MVFSSALLGMVALASAYLAASATSEIKKLPWEGYGQDLTVEALTNKYMTHILTMRSDKEHENVEEYVSIDQKGRSPAYNGDTGVINIGVDANAIFKEQHNFRRSELVQNVSVNADGTTFFRASIKKKDAFLNPYVWQCFFTETHIFEIRVDATVSPAKIIYLNNGTWDAKWEAEFNPGMWYNFGIAITAATSGKGSVLDFYTSKGDDNLVSIATHDVKAEFTLTQELHIGLLTLSDDETDPKMNAKQDILSFNGVSVGKKVVLSAAPSAESTGVESSPTQNAIPSTATEKSIRKGSGICASK